MNKQQEFEQLQHTLQQIFIKNFNFFKTTYPHLYQQIIEFENLHIENHSIEFINDSFQLINVHNKQTYYSMDPFVEAKQRLNAFSFSNAFAMIKLDAIKKERHYENEINAYEYLNEYIEQISDTNINHTIQKFVFIGTLLGVHLNDFHAQLQAKSYLIIEPDIEIFRLSMFLTDYTELAKDASLHFCIAQTSLEFNTTIQKFLQDKQEFNHLIHYELSHKTYEHYLETLSLQLTQFSEMRYPFSEYLISLKRGYHYFFKEKKPLLNLSNSYSFFNDKPVILLGAGPSLGENIQWLQEHKDKFIIVAASATLKQLELHNIAPDIVILIEGKHEVITQFPETNQIFKKSIILSSIKIDAAVYARLKDNPLFFMQNTLELFLENGFFSGITVGDVGIDVLLKLGSNELYLLGIDAAISKTGATYVNTHPSSSSVDLTQTKDSPSVDFEKDIHYVKGNFEDEVPTFTEYFEMIGHLKERLAHLNSDTRIYNLSDGAYFYNTTPRHPNDVVFSEDSFDKQSLHKELKIFLESHSKHQLNEKDIKAIQKEKKVLKKLMSLKADMNIYKNFLQLKRKFEYSIVMSIVNKYFHLTNPYYNFFEDKTTVEPIRQKQIETLFQKIDSIYSDIKER